MSANIETMSSDAISNTATERSRVSAGSDLSGDLRAPGTVELLGHVKGNVYADAIVIEDSGAVDGELHAANIGIKGKLEGKIIGGVVTLHASAQVIGEIFYEILTIENGAEVNAICAVRKAR